MTAMLSTLNCVAQTAAAPAPTPCEDDARFAEFDFWIGDWDVHTADGTYAGKNTISKAERGCVRQFFEQSDDGGETWAPWFEGFYTRNSDQ